MHAGVVRCRLWGERVGIGSWLRGVRRRIRKTEGIGGPVGAVARYKLVGLGLRVELLVLVVEVCGNRRRRRYGHRHEHGVVVVVVVGDCDSRGGAVDGSTVLESRASVERTWGKKQCGPAGTEEGMGRSGGASEGSAVRSRPRNAAARPK